VVTLLSMDEPTAMDGTLPLAHPGDASRSR